MTQSECCKQVATPPCTSYCTVTLYISGSVRRDCEVPAGITCFRHAHASGKHMLQASRLKQTQEAEVDDKAHLVFKRACIRSMWVSVSFPHVPIIRAWCIDALWTDLYRGKATPAPTLPVSPLLAGFHLPDCTEPKHPPTHLLIASSLVHQETCTLHHLFDSDSLSQKPMLPVQRASLHSQ